MKKKPAAIMTAADVHRFEKCQTQTEGFYEEVSQLAKKSPNDGLNKFKLRFINQAVELSNQILKDHKPFADFLQFSEDELPTNSDVAMMLKQYLISLESFRFDNIVYDDDHEWRWLVTDGSIIATEMPRKHL